MLRKCSVLLLSCVALLLLVAGTLAVPPSTDRTTAEETRPLVERTFIVPVGAGVEGPPRWESEDSLLLVVHKGAGFGDRPSSITFADNLADIGGIETRIEGKTFDCDFAEASVTHVTKGGPAYRISPGPYYVTTEDPGGGPDCFGIWIGVGLFTQ
ncbi:MAG: hypothetical protein ACYSWU_29095 [Planctomycetota bacterium]